jgi:hypothetical protein
MPTYCIKTSDIPAEELSQWKELGYLLEDSDIKSDISLQAYSNHWFNGKYLYIVPEQYVLLISSFTPPKQPYLPLTLAIFKQLAFLKLTGDCNATL